MMSRTSFASALLCAVAALAAIAAPAAAEGWVENGVPVGTATDFCRLGQVVPDGEHGAIFFWYQVESPYAHVYAQRRDAYGRILWTMPISTSKTVKESIQATSDGDGGAIIVWQQHNTDCDIYVQRVDADGACLWGTDGLVICSALEDQVLPAIAPDGEGGAVIVWEDDRDLTTDIYTQRVDHAGNRLWAMNGNVVCAEAYYQEHPLVAYCGNGNVIVAWEDDRSHFIDIYASLIQPDGNLPWGSSGRAICTAAEEQYVTDIEPDGFGGAVIVWHDRRSATNFDVYAQRVNSSGLPWWTADGLPICTSSNTQAMAKIASTGENSFFVCWFDDRAGNYDIYVQKIDLAGNELLTAGGKALTSNAEDQDSQQIVADGDGGAIIAWEDARFGIDAIYAQRIAGDGSEYWPIEGAPVSLGIGSRDTPHIVSDGAGGAIIGWFDNRDILEFHVYAQRMERNGYWGYPSPWIENVRDVPSDEGGFVNLAWDASRLDPWPEELIHCQTIWRAIDPAAAMALTSGGRTLLTGSFDPGEIAVDEGPVIRSELRAGNTYYWECIETIDAVRQQHYALTVPTAFDSTAAGHERSCFQVLAHIDGNVFWASPPDSGYSVDNLSPCAPLLLAGEQLFDPAGLQLTWEPNVEPDLGCYRVYRGTGEGFTPGPGNLVDEPCEAAFFDDSWHWEPGYWYKVSAIDVHGNESGYAVFGPADVTGDDTPPPLGTFLAQNVPNPFNPVTRIEFGLKEPGLVSLRIYDPAGRLVRDLVSGAHPAGRYAATWDGRCGNGTRAASGVYFCRLVTGGFTETKKMILMR